MRSEILSVLYEIALEWLDEKIKHEADIEKRKHWTELREAIEADRRAARSRGVRI